MATAHLHRIATATQIAGIPASTLRAWERRYQAVKPGRSDAGGRLYSEQDVQRLIVLKRAVDAGHAIGRIARLPDDKLAALAPNSPPDPAAPLRARFLAAIASFNPESADREISRAAALFPPHVFVRDVLAPLLREVGERWAHREIGIAQEHLASHVIRSLLVSLTRFNPPSETSRPVVLATPEGEPHEMGLLLAAFLAVGRHCRVIYLGPEVPPADLANAARRTNAAAIVLSLVTEDKEGKVAEQLQLLAALAPRGTAVWAGGPGVAGHRALLEAHSWKLLESLDALDRALHGLPQTLVPPSSPG